MTTRAHTTTGGQWGQYWATRPHIRFGDPCYACGIPLTPASACWTSWTIPEGMRRHGGHGLCSLCRNRVSYGSLKLDEEAT